MMLIVLSMAPLQSLGQDAQNEVQHDLLVRASVSLDANGLSMVPLNSLDQDDQNEGQHDILVI